MTAPKAVIPAKAGIQGCGGRSLGPWIPACAGMTADFADYGATTKTGFPPSRE
jgi:hypothetical protein